MENEEALRKAAQDGDDLLVKKFLAMGVPQTGNEMGETPLLLATSCYITEPKFVNVVRSLLNAGAKINEQNQDGNAAIHNAAFRGSLEIVELLLDNGADIELEGELGMVPLGLAATKRNHAIVNILVKRLVDENKFSRKQVEWMHNVENKTQQLNVYRALQSIFQQTEALKSLIDFGAVDAIHQGLKRYRESSILSSGLQLLGQCVKIPEGAEAARKADTKNILAQVCKDHASDAIIQHLANEVTSEL